MPPSTIRTILLCRCPRCSCAPLFDGYLAVGKNCSSCGLDYGAFNADDGPAFFCILIVGAIVCALALWVEFTWSPPLWVHAVLWLPLIVILTVVLQRLIKAALIVSQYRNEAGEGRIQ